MTEIWKDVVGYEGLYQVSNYGRVLSLNYRRTGKPGLLHPSFNQKENGYKQVYLFKNKLSEGCKVSRLVAMAFIPNPENLPEVNHIDEDKTNNCVVNLEWCTKNYNLEYGTRVKRASSKCRKPVNCYDLEGNLIKTYNSIKETAKDGFTLSCVNRCCKGQSNTHFGHIFRYA